MNIQTEIDFSTPSPINREKLSGQNRTVYNHLKSGKTINVYQAIVTYSIYHLHSRVSDIRKALKDTDECIYDRMIKANGINCKEYSLNPFI